MNSQHLHIGIIIVTALVMAVHLLLKKEASWWLRYFATDWLIQIARNFPVTRSLHTYIK